MFKRILVPLDGSIRAERALPIAAHIARETHGSILLVCVVNHFVLGSAAPARKNATLSESGSSPADAEAYLERVKQEYELQSLTVETIVLSGPIASTILSAAITYQANLIVLTSHGHSGVTRKALGSIADKVVCHTSIPVLLLPEATTLPFGLQEHPLRILVALSGPTFAYATIETAAELIAALASSSQGELHLARIVSPPEEVQRKHLYGAQAATVEQAQNSLNTIISYLIEGYMVPAVAKHKLVVTGSAIESEQIAETLVSIAEQGEKSEPGDFDGYDVLAIATHGLEGFQRLTFGSVAARVIALSRCPLLLVRPSNSQRSDHTMKDHVTAL